MEERSSYLKFFSVVVLFLLGFRTSSAFCDVGSTEEQPLSKIAMHKVTLGLRESVTIRASPVVLGLQVLKNFIS